MTFGWIEEATAAQIRKYYEPEDPRLYKRLLVRKWSDGLQRRIHRLILAPEGLTEIVD